MPFTENTLGLFNPVIREWMQSVYPSPTDIQTRAWPVIAEGRHALITAPTGMGKTLTAFLWAINQLVTGTWKTGGIRVLYISPLKALNSDIRVNLTEPLTQVRKSFEKKGLTLPAIRVALRSGDTPAYERQKILKNPPEILITTPESLNLLLCSPKARDILCSLKTVILDEIHSIAASKRGAHLLSAVERLVLLSGEFQRIALSATVKPLERIADFVGGFKMSSAGGEIKYMKRPVEIVQSPSRRKMEINVTFPDIPPAALIDNSYWPHLALEFRKIIKGNRATLLFVNTRKLSESIAKLVNEGEEEPIAYSHHGSLSKEIRLVVEKRLKRGELKSIVATASLELGIDIGSVDEVVLVQTPPSVSQALQRIGRSGHAVGRTVRGVIFPTHGMDFLEAAIMVRSVLDQDIEEVKPVENPLDVLAQVVLAMAAMEEWDIDELYGFLRTCRSFHTLPRRQFDLVIKMLSGEYSATRIAELNPRISVDRLENTVKGRRSVLTLLYHSGGTIADRGYFDMRLRGTGEKIGDLDEEFVWERRVGHTFSLGTQNWKITDMDHKTVHVVPYGGQALVTVFWKGERGNRDTHFSLKIASFLEEWQDRFEQEDFAALLKSDCRFSDIAVKQLVGFLKRHVVLLKTGVPHRHHIVIEHFDDPVYKTKTPKILIHTLWGARINVPYAYAIARAWEEKMGYPLETVADDNSIILMLAHEFNREILLSLVDSGSLMALLRKKLETTSFFGSRFRENAQRSLLIPRASFSNRMPLWLTRLRSKKLLDSVMQYDDFPVLVETWRGILNEDFDLSMLNTFLNELHEGRIKCSEAFSTAPSPFAGSAVFRQTDKHMYQDDTPFYTKSSRLSGSLIEEVARSKDLRPEIGEDIVELFEKKVKRTMPGYGPRDSRELLDFVKERVIIPLTEWENLVDASARERNLNRADITEDIAGKIVRISLPSSAIPCVLAVETVPVILSALSLSLENVVIDTLNGKSPEKALQEIRRLKSSGILSDGPDAGEIVLTFLRAYGPVPPEFVTRIFGIENDLLMELLAPVLASDDVVVDGDRICLASNLEKLLRMKRASHRSAVKPVGREYFQLFLSAYHSLIRKEDGMEGFKKVLERNFGIPLPAELWESDVFPCRLRGYRRPELDALLESTGLVVYGSASRKLGFCLQDDYEIIREPAESQGGDTFLKLFAFEGKTVSFWDLKDSSGLDSGELTGLIWELFWNGLVSTREYDLLRKGMAFGFEGEELFKGSGRRKKLSYDRWAASRPVAGSFFRLPDGIVPSDRLEEQDIVRNRIELLLDRYGILIKEVLAAEIPLFHWGSIMRTLQILELSREIETGYFIEGYSGPQFASREALALLKECTGEKGMYVINAADPACVSDLSRHPSTHAVFRGKDRLMVSRKNGQDLDIDVPVSEMEPGMFAMLFSHLLKRDYKPLKQVKISTINGRRADESPYTDAFKAGGFIVDYRTLILERDY
ncbi:MAG: DEAD/DEAH box helicase [Spirochaetales bacterium]|nr:DEAD/DEAH box helicase [Spirochaetales bacterium]